MIFQGVVLIYISVGCGDHSSAFVFGCVSFELYFLFVILALEIHGGWILFQSYPTLCVSSFCVAFLDSPKPNFSISLRFAYWLSFIVQ